MNNEPQGCPVVANVASTGATVLFMIVERFINADPLPVYRRFREHGRLAPDGLTYVASWVDESLEQCFQLMQTDDPELLNEWMDNWRDIVEFSVYPVISSSEAAEKVDRLMEV